MEINFSSRPVFVTKDLLNRSDIHIRTIEGRIIWVQSLFGVMENVRLVRGIGSVWKIGGDRFPLLLLKSTLPKFLERVYIPNRKWWWVTSNPQNRLWWSSNLERMNVETKYLRMIQGMKRRGRKDWTVYILRCKLLYQQEGLTRSKALIREAQIKAMPRSKKEEIIFSEHCV